MYNLLAIFIIGTFMLFSDWQKSVKKEYENKENDTYYVVDNVLIPDRLTFKVEEVLVEYTTSDTRIKSVHDRRTNKTVIVKTPVYNTVKKWKVVNEKPVSNHVVFVNNQAVNINKDTVILAPYTTGPVQKYYYLSGSESTKRVRTKHIPGNSIQSVIINKKNILDLIKLKKHFYLVVFTSKSRIRSKKILNK